jgi:hemin uptake protein HemP
MNIEETSFRPLVTPDPRGLPPDGGTTLAVASGRGVRWLTSAELFARHSEVQIEHHGSVYRLKQTSLGKLILTK